MMLKSFNSLLGLLIFLITITAINAEEKIDIWKNDTNNKKEISAKEKELQINTREKITINNQRKIDEKEIIKIDSELPIASSDIKVYGIYDPADYDFSLNMWSTTKAEEVRASIKRLKKIKLSQTSNEILENILFSFAYPPEGMSNKEFISLKIDWLIDNNRTDLIESFLKQNEEFVGKRKLVQFIVDENISKADIKTGCEKIKFIDTTIKDAYLEKFKIYCLIFNNNKSQARLLLDLLREQNQSDKFFDDKINYLLGITEKTTNKINEKNLLNFYL